jgi:hypothetical protein
LDKNAEILAFLNNADRGLFAKSIITELYAFALSPWKEIHTLHA